MRVNHSSTQETNWSVGRRKEQCESVKVLQILLSLTDFYSLLLFLERYLGQFDFEKPNSLSVYLLNDSCVSIAMKRCTVANWSTFKIGDITNTKSLHGLVLEHMLRPGLSAFGPNMQKSFGH